MRAIPNDALLDPVAAYDRVAPAYSRLAERRKAYLAAVDRIIGEEIPPGSRSMLDVGAGNGSRAQRIALGAGLRDLVLLEPSAAMRNRCPAEATLWAMRAEELSRQQSRFDVITCLWNVLGHIFPSGARAEALRQFARLISPSGRIFIDVNHRYNARHYGVWITAARFFRDRFRWTGHSGDVTITWNIEGHCCSTMGHVFTHKEFASLARAAGLSVEKRFVVDYATGQRRRWSVDGNLLYELRAPDQAVRSG